MPVDLQSLTPTQLRARGTIKWNLYPADVLPLWVAEMDYPTAPPVLAAIREAVDVESFGYPLDAQQSELAEETAAWLARERPGAAPWTVDPRGIFSTGDVMRGVDLALRTLVDRTAPVIITTPVYMPFFDAVPLAGLRHVEVPMMRAEGRHDGRWTFDLDGIERAFADGARTLLLCSPYNPLGLVFTRAELLALADIVARYRGRVISDEIHAPLVLSGEHVPYASLTPETARHTVTMVAASKAWNLPGLKCAQLVASNDADVDVLRRLPHLATTGVSTLGTVASIAAYREGGPWLEQVLALLDHHADRVAEAVSGMPGVRHTRNEGTYLAWLDCSELGLDVEPADWFREQARVALSDGRPFGAPEHRYARLNFATTTAILDEALERMSAALRSR